jgi:hypothetical protein
MLLTLEQALACGNGTNPKVVIMIMSRDEYMTAIKTKQDAISNRLIGEITREMNGALEEGAESFSVSLAGFPVDTYDDVLQPYREAGWTVTSSNDRNESMLNFS